MKKLLVAIMGVLLLTGCTTKKAIQSDITEFNLSFGYGLGGAVDRKIVYQNDTYEYTFEGYGELNKKYTKNLTTEQIKELEKIINDNKIYEWDGFDKSDDDVLDGSSFGITIKYADGSKIDAHGYMKYPKEYKERIKAVQDFFDKIDEE